MNKFGGMIYYEEKSDQYFWYQSFDCNFTEDVKELTVDENTIAGFDKDGNEIFCHAYTHIDDAYYNGDCAYWMASGFLKEAPENMIEDCINLFVTENAEDFSRLIE